jgi:hypothetical protein
VSERRRKWGEARVRNRIWNKKKVSYLESSSHHGGLGDLN